MRYTPSKRFGILSAVAAHGTSRSFPQLGDAAYSRLSGSRIVGFVLLIINVITIDYSVFLDMI